MLLFPKVIAAFVVIVVGVVVVFTFVLNTEVRTYLINTKQYKEEILCFKVV